MHYYIDGYNLMFRTLRAGNDLQSQRKQIIRNLNEKVQILGLDVTVVFDAQYQISESTRTHYDYLEIYFTDRGQTADEYILDDLKKKNKPQLHTVITSDKKLAWLARLRSAKTESVEVFNEWLNKRYLNKLRELKNRTSPSKTSNFQYEKPKTEPVLKKAIEPAKNSSPEECFDFYLNLFEENFQELVKNESDLKPQKIKKKSFTKKKKELNVNIRESSSILEYWEKAFNRNLEIDTD